MAHLLEELWECPHEGQRVTFPLRSRVSGSSSFPSHDEVVELLGDEVVWRSGCGLSVRKRLSLSAGSDSPVLQALFSCFSSDVFPGDAKGAPLVRCLCVLRPECLHIYSVGGSVYEVALPCKASRMWALRHGLLIQRDTTTAAAITTSTSDIGNGNANTHANAANAAAGGGHAASSGAGGDGTFFLSPPDIVRRAGSGGGAPGASAAGAGAAHGASLAEDAGPRSPGSPGSLGSPGCPKSPGSPGSPSSPSMGGSGMNESQDMASPMLFSLLHPIEELKPVSVVDPGVAVSAMGGVASSASASLRAVGAMGLGGLGRGGGDNTFQSFDSERGLEGDFLCDPSEQVLFTVTAPSLAISFNRMSLLHTIWAVKPVERPAPPVAAGAGAGGGGSHSMAHNSTHNHTHHSVAAAGAASFSESRHGSSSGGGGGTAGKKRGHDGSSMVVGGVIGGSHQIPLYPLSGSSFDAGTSLSFAY